jgi:hypothetical protein
MVSESILWGRCGGRAACADDLLDLREKTNCGLVSSASTNDIQVIFVGDTSTAVRHCLKVFTVSKSGDGRSIHVCMLMYVVRKPAVPQWDCTGKYILSYPTCKPPDAFKFLIISTKSDSGISLFKAVAIGVLWQVLLAKENTDSHS